MDAYKKMHQDSQLKITYIEDSILIYYVMKWGMVIAYYVSDNPTDHYELIPIMENLKEVLPVDAINIIL